MTYVCPRCHGALSSAEEALVCDACARAYPVEDGIADFSEGEYYDAFSSERDVTPVLLQGLEDEVAGTRARVGSFFLPRLRSRFGRVEGLRILDCGCGNGLATDLLVAAGADAWGNDSSKLRRWQWRGRENPARLCVASGSRLPFPAASFDVVVSSGVLEHVGVVETAGPPYAVRPAPTRDDERLVFLRELLRVVGPSGVVWLDFPNGAFPIDFWHGTGAGGARFHSTSEGFLPKVGEVRKLVRRVDPALRLRAVSPSGRLQFKRVRRRWFGKLFSPAIAAFFSAMKVPGLRGLAASPLNPYLALEIENPARKINPPGRRDALGPGEGG
ncbi:MAG TPA: methyltransferase domain-containing protein [Thermoanaerobaculia bacterium]|nr:methyltransferase domain-containing protein [Thermoanaerobaculia bacterium]